MLLQNIVREDAFNTCVLFSTKFSCVNIDWYYTYSYVTKHRKTERNTTNGLRAIYLHSI